MLTTTPSPSFKINGIDCGIYLGEHGDEGGIRYSWGDKGLEVDIDFLCDWNHVVKVLQGLRGSVVTDNTSGGKITRNAPFSLPFSPDTMPDLPGLTDVPYAWGRYVCMGTGEIKGVKVRIDQDASITGQAGWVYYDWAVIPCRFAVPTYFIGTKKQDVINPYLGGFDLSGYPYTTTTTKPSGEVFQADAACYKFAHSQDPVNEAKAGFFHVRTEITIARHYMPWVDVEQYENMIGKTNGEAINIGTERYDTDSILYMSYEVEPYGDPSTGLTCYDIKHQMIGNGRNMDLNGNVTTDWNYFLTPTGLWDLMIATNGGARPYTSVPFKHAIWPEYED